MWALQGQRSAKSLQIPQAVASNDAQTSTLNSLRSLAPLVPFSRDLVNQDYGCWVHAGQTRSIDTESRRGKTSVGTRYCRQIASQDEELFNSLPESDRTLSVVIEFQLPDKRRVRPGERWLFCERRRRRCLIVTANFSLSDRRS